MVESYDLLNKNSFVGLLIFTLIFQTLPAVASSWNPALLVNTETFQTIDDSDTASDLYVRFGDSLNKRLTFERTLDRFNFNDDVYVSGDVNVKGTASGKTIYATESLRSSGSLVWEGAASGASLWVSKFRGAGLTSCNADGETLGWNSVSQQFECGDDDTGAGGSTAPAQGLTSPASGFLALSAIHSGTSLEILGTSSGRILHGNDKIQGSGSLITDGSITTKTNLTINSDNGASDAVLTFGNNTLAETLTFSVGNGRFEFSDDVYVGSTLEVDGNAQFDGGTLTIGDASGDAVTVNSAGWTFANDSTVALSGGENGLNFDSNTLSIDASTNRIGIGTATPKYEVDAAGSIHASVGLSSSGTLVWEGSASGASLWVSKFKGAGLVTSCNADGETLAWNATSQQFECGDDDTGAGGSTAPAQGLTSPASGFLALSTSFSGTSMEIIGTASGKTIFANDTLASSGNLIVESLWKRGSGAIVSLGAEYQTGAYLYASGASILALDTYTDQRNGGQSRAPHILFGYQGAFDTNLFRHAANILMTDDSFRVRGTLSGSNLWVNNLSTSGAVIYSSGSQLRATARPGTGNILVGQGTAPPIWKDPVSALTWYVDGALSTGTSQGPIFTMPYGMTVSSVVLRIKTAPTGAALIVDINEGGTTLFSTRPEIAASATTGGSSAVFSDTVLAKGSEISVDIDQVGSTVAGSSITIQLHGVRKY